MREEPTLADHYTRRQVTRILGVTERQLDYWQRLRLVRRSGRSRRGLYDFDDLIALRTIRDLTGDRVPAYRLRRALRALEQQTGAPPASLSAVRAVACGRDVVVIPPAPHHQPFAPLKRQFVFGFFGFERSRPVRTMTARTAEDWFETALELETDPEMLQQAAEAYRRALALAPDWTEARMNLGSVLYQLNELEEACNAFRGAVRLEPENPSAYLNLGCVLFERGFTEGAIGHLRRAVQLAPCYADAHLNLALAYDKRGDEPAARTHWLSYLRFEPEGPWSDYARARMGRPRNVRPGSKTIPFPKVN